MTDKVEERWAVTLYQSLKSPLVVDEALLSQDAIRKL